MSVGLNPPYAPPPGGTAPGYTPPPYDVNPPIDNQINPGGPGTSPAVPIDNGGNPVPNPQNPTVPFDPGLFSDGLYGLGYAPEPAPPYVERPDLNEYDAQTGVGGNLNQDLDLGISPDLLNYGELGMAGGAGTLSREAQASRAAAYTRQAQQDEMSAYHLDQMLGSDSPLMQRARQKAYAGAAGRGLMNSSIAQGAAMGSMIDRASPFALQDATMHQRAATESLAAQNQASLTNAQLQTQASLGNMNAQAALDRDRFAANIGGQQDALRHLLGMETREDQQQWQDRQNRLSEAWQSGENRQAAMEKWAINEATLLEQRGATREQAMAQVIAGIYQNPDMTAAEQNAAARNAKAIMADTFGSYTGTPQGPPGYYGTNINNRPVMGPQPQSVAQAQGMGTTPSANPKTVAANQAAGQVVDSQSSPAAQSVSEALPPVI